MSEEIVKKNKTEMFKVTDKKALDLMSKDAENHVDGTAIEDLEMPRIKILQSGSPEVKKSDPKCIKGAEEGDTFNTLTSEVTKAKDGFYFVPVQRRITYIEWKPIDSGGGMVNKFGTDPSEYLKLDTNDKGAKVNEAGNEIVKSYEFLGYVINKQTMTFQQAFIGMSNTKAKKARKLNSFIMKLSDEKTGKTLPEYAGVYDFSTIPESNDKNSWFNYDIKQFGYTLGIPKIGDMLYEKAKAFAIEKSFESVNIKGYDEQEEAQEKKNDKV